MITIREKLITALRLRGYVLEYGGGKYTVLARDGDPRKMFVGKIDALRVGEVQSRAIPSDKLKAELIREYDKALADESDEALRALIKNPRTITAKMARAELARRRKFDQGDIQAPILTAAILTTSATARTTDIDGA